MSKDQYVVDRKGRAISDAPLDRVEPSEEKKYDFKDGPLHKPWGLYPFIYENSLSLLAGTDWGGPGGYGSDPGMFLDGVKFGEFADGAGEGFGGSTPPGIFGGSIPGSAQGSGSPASGIAPGGGVDNQLYLWWVFPKGGAPASCFGCAMPVTPPAGWTLAFDTGTLAEHKFWTRVVAVGTDPIIFTAETNGIEPCFWNSWMTIVPIASGFTGTTVATSAGGSCPAIWTGHPANGPFAFNNKFYVFHRSSPGATPSPPPGFSLIFRRDLEVPCDTDLNPGTPNVDTGSALSIASIDLPSGTALSSLSSDQCWSSGGAYTILGFRTS